MGSAATIVNHNILSMNASRNLNIQGGKLSKSVEKLSSGMRINRAADDAAGLAISEKMRAQIRGTQQASTNAQDGISMIQTTEGALTEAHDIVQRVRELTIQASNGTLENEDRVNIQLEVTQLAEEISSMAEKTTFNQKNVLEPVETVVTFQVGANDGNTSTFEFSKLIDITAGVAATNLATQADATGSLVALDKDILDIAGYRASLGAFQNRLEHTVNNLDVSAENLQAAESRIRDTDMANEMAKYSSTNILSQAANSMLAQANSSTQNVLSLLR